MASASRRFLFETIEPRVLLSGDLAPGVTVHKPADIDVTALSLPPVAPLYTFAPASDVRVLPAAPIAAPTLSTPADAVAANFTLQVQGAGSATGSYQFQLPAISNASAGPGSQSNSPTYDPSHVPVVKLASNTVLPAADAATDPAGAPPAAATRSQPASAPSASTAPKAIAFVDSALPDYQGIVKAISNSDQSANTDIVVLDSTKSEIQQITDSLAGRHDIAAIHIFSHGFEANLELGAVRLDAAGLDAYASQLSSWSAALRPGADLLLYGCDIGAGDDGTAFINRLSQLTGANVAASTDDTGGSQLGGNWMLEKSTGAIEAALPASKSALASYDHLLATVQWTGGGDGVSWSDSGNWSGGVVPGAGDSVIIAAANGDPAITITSTSGVVKLASLNSSRPITISSGATLQATTVDFSKNITLAGGTIQGGTLTASSGATLVVSGNTISGTLSGVILNGDASVTGSSSALRINSGLTLNGTIHLASSDAELRAFGNQTFAGNGTISFEGTTGSLRLLTIEGPSTLTLGSTFKVVGGYATVGDWSENGSGPRSLVNNGLISSNVLGQTLTILPSGSFTNAGTIEAIGGGILTVTASNWTDAGTLHIDANAASTVNLGGTFDVTGGIGTFDRAGGVVNLTGTVLNTGSTLTLNATTGSWNLANGTVNGGTVSFADGAALLLATSNVSGAFSNGVTLNGDLTISGSNAGLFVSGGMTLNGTIHLTGSSAHVSAQTSQTFAGNGTISFEGTTGGVRLLTIEGTATLTLGSTFKVVGGYGSVGDWWSTNGTRTLINNGLISASVAGQTINVIPNVSSNFVNGTLQGGTWQAVNGGILRLLTPSAIAVNAATILIDGANSSFVHDNATTNALSGLIGNAAGASLTIQNGYTITTAGDFTNAGAITVGAGSIFALSGAFTQTGGSVNLQGGTIGNMAPPPGNALHFDGNDFVEMADSPTLHSSADLTVSGWFKADGFPRTWQNIFFKGDTPDPGANGLNREFGLWLNSAGNLEFASTPVSQVGTGQDTLDTQGGLVKAGQWYHFDAEVSAAGNFMRLYLNGQLVAQRTYDASGIRDTTGPFRIGQAPGWDNSFQGSIDEVAVWSTIRSPDQIRTGMFRRLTGSETGLNAYWNFDYTNSTVADVTGHGNTGYLGSIVASQPSWTSGPALAFDGVNDNVQIADATVLQPASALTVEAWVTFGANYASGTRAIIAKPVGNGSNDSYIVDYSSGQLRASVGGASGFIQVSYAWSPVQDSSHHIASTYDAAGLKLYVDGVLVASTASTTTLDYDSHPLVIGGDYDFNTLGHFWSGNISDVRLWNVARSVADIQADMHNTLTGSEAGLLGNWRLDDGSGIVARDVSTNPYSGLLGGTLDNQPAPVSTEAAAPPVTTSLAFDGVDNNVKIADAANLRPTNALTIEAWVNTGDNFTANTRTVFGKTVGTGIQDSYIIWYAGDQLHAAVGNSSNATTNLSYDWDPAQNTWHRIAFTYDATGPKLYVDGVMVASNTSTTTIGYDTHPVIIGDDYNNEQLGQAWSGKLAEISLWNVALTPAQILATAQTLTGTEAGLIGYWRLNEGSGAVAHDLSSGGNNGVIAGTGPVWVTNQNGSVTLQGGTLSGSGTVAADLTNAAQVNVGGTGAAGALVVTGNYTQTATGALNIEVGGTVAGTQFDQLQVDGVATLAGALNVGLINSFQPSSGQVFEIETFDTLIGAFATINGLPPGLQANYTSTDLVLISQIIGITVTPTLGLQTTEAGGTASFSVVLDGQPTSDVYIDIASDNEAEGTVSVKTLHFTPQNWNVPQIVTVTGVDDAVQDGDVVYHVILKKAVSSDPSYDGFDPSDVTLTNLDNDHAGLSVTPVSGLVTTESGGQASYTVALTSQPTADVTISLTSSAPSEGTVTPLTLTFTAQNWNTAQTVTVTGVDDQLIDGDVAYKITGTASSADPNYNGTKLPDVGVVNRDNDTRDLQIGNLALTPSSGLQSGGSVLVTWTDSNVGNLATSGAFNDLIVVKNVTTGQTLVSATVPYDPTVPGNGNIAGGSSRQRQFSFRLPDGTAGVGQIQVTTTVNDLRGVTESDSSGANNVATVTQSSALAPYPDLQVSGLTLSGVSLQPPSGASNLFNHNLVVNGNAEAGSAGDPFPGWTATGNPALLLYSGGTPSATDPGPVDRGANLFGGGQNTASSSLAQTIDLTAASATIDAGAAHFALGGYLGGYASQDDNATLTAKFLAADGTVLASTTIGPVTSADRSNATGLLARTATDLVPVGARSVMLTLAMTRVAGSDDDGYADNLSYSMFTGSSPTSLQSGDLVLVQWNDVNTGNGETSGAWQDQVVVRNTTTGQVLISQNVPYDPLIAANGNIEAGGARARQMAFTLPDGAAGVGNIEVTVTADGANNVFEYNSGGTAETNNSSVATVASTAASYPDLVVNNLSIDPPSNVTSGSTVTIHWTDDNTGARATPIGWTDKVVIENSTTGETLATLLVPYDPAASGNGGIEAGGSRARQASYQLPDGLRGIGQITVTVTVDGTNVVVENNAAGSAEANNASSVTFNSVSAPYADLQVTNIHFDPPTGLKSGDTFVVSWDDSNLGTKATTVGWTDLVVVKNLTTGEVLATVSVPYDPAQSGAIAAGAARTRQYTGKLPDGTRGVGQIQVTITADSNNNVYEYNSAGTAETNNASAATVTSSIGAYADLLPANLSVEAPAGLQSGRNVVLHWDDRNIGAGPTSGSWYDYVTVTNLTTGEVLDTIPVPYTEPASGNGPIAAGDLRSRQLNYLLPAGLRGSGQIQFSITADDFNQLFEFNTAGNGGSNTAESNNVASVTVTSVTAPAPDLQVANLLVTPSAGLKSGDSAVLSWDVQNTGNAGVTGQFYSHVEIRNVTTNAVIASDDVLYDPSVAGNGVIAAGTKRTQQFGFTLPKGSSGAGQLSFTVTTDFYNQVDESNTAGTNNASTAETNNAASITADAALAPYADLATSAVTAPSLTVADPATVTIGWTVGNVGGAATTVDNWTDTIIVSSDANPADGTVIGQLNHVGALAAGATYQASLSITLPPAYQTHSHLFVRTDATDAVFENGIEANNYAEASNMFDVVPAPYADLAVTNLVAPSSGDSSQPLQVSWTVTNQSPHAIGTTNTSDWSDSVALATDPQGNRRSDRLVRSRRRASDRWKLCSHRHRVDSGRLERHVLRRSPNRRPVGVHLHRQ